MITILLSKWQLNRVLSLNQCKTKPNKVHISWYVLYNQYEKFYCMWYTCMFIYLIYKAFFSQCIYSSRLFSYEVAIDKPAGV